MSFVNLNQLPFAGMSHEFIGEEHGAPISIYFVNAPPDRGPVLHTHPYVETVIVLEGCATLTVADQQREVKPGDVAVIPAGVAHRFVNTGNTDLRQIDIHASPKFIQTDLA